MENIGTKKLYSKMPTRANSVVLVRNRMKPYSKNDAVGMVGSLFLKE